MARLDADIVVVGGGNAALCAALAAREGGAKVLVLERAPKELRGGNSRFAAGTMRVVFDGVEDLLALVPDLTEEEIRKTDFGTYSPNKYTEEEFFGDIARITDFRADPDLASLVVARSHETLGWMRERGIRFGASFGRQAFEVDGRFKFWGGVAVEAWGGGEELVNALYRAVERERVEVLYGARAFELLADESGVRGVKIRRAGEVVDVWSRAVILACGGFEANAEWRARYLGPGWDLAKVRGTRYNTGDGIQMALSVGALPYGNWSGCHAVGWDRNAPDFGDLSVGDGFQKHSYPFGIMVNAEGTRFVDEGADFRNFTYAKYGRRILEQPGQFAWQVFDGKVLHLLRDEYKIREVTKLGADTLEDLANRMEGVNASMFLATVDQFNSAVRTDVPFNPNVLDGRGTEGLSVPKSNWANTIDEPPFEAYQVTCGITFSFGGLAVDTNAQVIDMEGDPIPGLYAAGELVGGLYYSNYPGGTGLTAGAVLGRIAGQSASRR